MEVIELDINLLKPAEYNPRALNEKEKADLAASLDNFGMVEPIVVNKAKDRENIIIGGHQRYFVLKEKGVKTIPVVYVNIPDIEKEKELNLRLNKNLGHWEWDMLANFNEEFLKEVGFDSGEMDKIFRGLKEDDFLEEPTEVISKSGELYKLGDHRLFCGDSTNEDHLKALMGGGMARLVFTDPPYMVDYKSPGGLSYDSKKFGGTGGKIFNDNLDEKDALDFYVKVLKNLYNFSTDDCTIYWWFANKNHVINRMAFKQSGWHMSQVIIWLKNSMVFSRGQDYHRVYEPCMVGWKQKKVHYKTKILANLKDVFSLDKESFEEILDVWYENRDVTQDYIHPTQKPVRLAERALKKNSEREDVVLDLFGGSGSTLIACEQMNRRCYMMELDPKYCDAIRKRYAQFIGKGDEWEKITEKM
jgi:DNA modification methylase